MASFTISNEEASLTINEHASEIHSFKDRHTDIEYMWQGDPAFWSGRNPTLFPMVGSTWDHKLHIQGKEYTTGNHGFTRHSDFTCIRHTSDSVVMELRDSEETRKQYPFAFTMHITYTLKGKTVSIHYEIVNDNETVMPFNFGLHPAFRCPETEDAKFEDYHIAFNQPETIDWLTTHLQDTKRLDLDREALQNTVIITDPKSTEATLTNGKHGVTIHFEGYRWLAFWSPHAPFVCMEPWYSHTDFEKVEVPFEKREGTLFLDPKKTFTADYSITIF
jgi:galactose mutarotase-like enzyme